MGKSLFFFLAFPSLLFGASQKYQTIEENEEGFTELHSLARKAEGFYEELWPRFSRFSLNLDAKDQYGNTPLMYAVRNSFTDLIRILVTLGADTTLRNKEGKTAWSFMRDIKKDSPERYAIRDILKKYPRNNFEKNTQNFFRRMFSCAQRKLIVSPMVFSLVGNIDSSRENSRDSF
jgi:ankyrin repeat protein